jgi:hypothetical protein
MNIRRMAAVGTAGLLSAAILAAGPAGAQEGGELAPLTVDPTSGPAGTVISVSGADCLDEGVATVSSAYLFRFDGDEPTEDDLLDIVDVDAEEDGTWAASLTMPAGLDPEGVYLVSATCFLADSEQIVIDYEAVEFDLTGAAPTAPPADTPPPALTPAPAAAPVRAQPTFTG